MRLYYYKSARGNFGDDLNAWLWEDLMPGIFDEEDSEVAFAGIGTIITTSMPKAEKWIVFTSGAGYGYPPIGFGGPKWDIISVRGPLSAKVLNLDARTAITDGAALLSTLNEFKPLAENDRSGIIFIPHHNALDTGRWKDACKRANIDFLSPEEDSKVVIQRIRRAKLVLADAMHAAIIADAMRVPWVPLVTSKQINTFKWLDWTQSINMQYSPLILGSSSFRESLRNRFLRIYGEKYFIDNATIEDAITYFLYQQKIKSFRLWNRYASWSKRITFHIPDKFFSMLEASVNSSWDEKWIDTAVEKLNIAKNQGGYLSNDNIFEKNVILLQEGLEKIKKMNY